jgi:hypothetical protein
MTGATPRVRARLPAAFYDLAIRLGARPQIEAAQTRLTQTGRMKARLDAKSWMSFTARQTISTCGCAFDWRARFGPLGLVGARDALCAGEGQFALSVLGLIPITRAASTDELLRGQLMRYLAELAWAPDAILHNAALRWRAEGPDQLVVSAGTGAAASEVVLSLDGEGRIAGAFAPDRPRALGSGFAPTPWRGRFFDYRRHQERWLPFAGEVAWLIDGEEATYWQGRLTGWRPVPLGT